MPPLGASINLKWLFLDLSTPSIRFVAKKFVPVFKTNFLAVAKLPM